MILIGVILFYVAVAVMVLIDYRKILRERYIDHSNKIHWIWKAVACIPSIVTLSWVSGAKWIWAISFTSFMIASWFWLFFDSTLNILRGYHWLYVGSEDGKMDAATDNLLQGIPVFWRGFIKISLCVVSLYIYIKLLP